MNYLSIHRWRAMLAILIVLLLLGGLFLVNYRITVRASTAAEAAKLVAERYPPIGEMVLVERSADGGYAFVDVANEQLLVVSVGAQNRFFRIFGEKILAILR